MDSLMRMLSPDEAVVERMRQVHQQVWLWRDLAAAMREDSQRLRDHAQQLRMRSRAIVQSRTQCAPQL